MFIDFLKFSAVLQMARTELMPKLPLKHKLTEHIVADIGPALCEPYPVPGILDQPLLFQFPHLFSVYLSDLFSERFPEIIHRDADSFTQAEKHELLHLVFYRQVFYIFTDIRPGIFIKPEVFPHIGCIMKSAFAEQ